MPGSPKTLTIPVTRKRRGSPRTNDSRTEQIRDRAQRRTDPACDDSQAYVMDWPAMGEWTDAKRLLLDSAFAPGYVTVIAGAIDKLDLRIPRGTPLRPDLEEILEYVTHNGPPGCVRATRLYEKRADLSRLGRKFNVSLCNRRDGNHKLELIDAGEMTLPDICARINELFEVDWEHLEVMRVDLGVNVDGQSSEVFSPNCQGPAEAAQLRIRPFC